MIATYAIERGAIQRTGGRSVVVRYYDALGAEVAMTAYTAPVDVDLDARSTAYATAWNASLSEREQQRDAELALKAKHDAVLAEAVRDGTLTRDEAERLGLTDSKDDGGGRG